jgi:alcohol dehydrogenase
MRFYLPTRIIFGAGEIQRLGAIVREELQARKAFLVTDKGIRQTGIVDQVLNELHPLEIFDEVEPNPRHPTVNRGGELARKLKPDLVVGLGGGSALDAAKAIALLGTNPGGIEDYEGREKYRLSPLPVLAIPTTCGTGSEVTWVSVVTHTGRAFKMSIKGPKMFPVLALVDPDLLRTLPRHLIASTGMDALTHAIEAYTVKPATFITDAFARAALKRIFHSLEEAYRDIKTNAKAREEIMMGSLLAGLAFGNSDVGAVHCIAEAVGSLYDTPHGVANAVFLPYVMEFNLPVCYSRYAELAEIAGIRDDLQGSARKFIEKVKSLSRSLKIPASSELGIEPARFSEVAQKSSENNSNPSNPRPAGVGDYLAILEAAYSAK